MPRRKREISEQDFSLHQAIVDNNIRKVTALIKAKHSTNKLNSEGHSPLYLAFFGSACVNLKIIKLLTDNGADFKSFSTEHPILKSLLKEEGGYTFASALVEKGLNPNQKYSGKSLLHIALNEDDETMLKQLIGLGADPNVKDEGEVTPLYRAVQKNKEEMVKILLRNGANQSIPDTKGRTVLHLAASKGNTDLLELLLSYSPDLEKTDSQGVTPLMAALYQGAYHDKATVRLLEKGAKLDVLIKKQGAKKVLLDAIDNQALDLIKAFQRSGLAVPDFSLCELIKSRPENYNGEGAKTLECLIKLGMNVNVQDESGNSPLHYASHESDVEILINNHAKIELENKMLYTPLFSAAERRNIVTVDCLLQKGADPYHLANQVNIMQVAKGRGPGQSIHNLFSKSLKKRIAFKPEILEKIQEQLVLFFQYCFEQASKSNKKLMILLGEKHGDYRVYQLLKVALNSAKKVEGVSHLFVEYSCAIEDRILDLAISHGIKNLKFELVSADINRREDDFNFNVSEVGMVLRNAGIRDTIHTINQSGVLITGTAHLYGLLDSKTTCIDRDAFYVVPFNFSKFFLNPNIRGFGCELKFADGENNTIFVDEKGFSQEKAYVTLEKWNGTGKKLGAHMRG